MAKPVLIVKIEDINPENIEKIRTKILQQTDNEYHVLVIASHKYREKGLHFECINAEGGTELDAIAIQEYIFRQIESIR